MSDFLFFLYKNHTIKQFEDWVYNSTELENIVSSKQHQLLLEFNYRNIDSKDKLNKLIKENILSIEEYQLWDLNNILIKSGWYNGREFKITNLSSSIGSKAALNIIKEYGGLKIDKTDNIFRSIEFTKEVFEIKNEYTMLAITENTYVNLLINTKNEFYYLFDVTGEFKYAGNNLRSILAKLLFSQAPW